MVAIATFRDHHFEGRARGLQVALLERTPRVVKALVVAPLRLRDGGPGGTETTHGIGRGGVDECDAAEDEGSLARVTGLEQSPALGEQSLDPLAIGRCHYMFPRGPRPSHYRKSRKGFSSRKFLG